MQQKEARISSRPHVKWEMLLVGIVAISIAVTMLFLCFFRELMVGAPLHLVAVVAYGWPFALLAGMVGISAIAEEFLPSYRRYKTFKQQEDYKTAVKAAVRKSIRSNQRKDRALYEEFLEENPQYKFTA